MAFFPNFDYAPEPKEIGLPSNVIFGRSPAMAAVRNRLERIASTDVPVLIQGESGTGKEILARLIHQASPANKGPFVKINCPAIPGTLVESELFGYEKGAFTGAVRTKSGRMEMAQSGVLFLDEIGEMNIELQSKLLQVLQDGHFCRIGAHQDQVLEARLICATNRNLEEEIARKAFRQDLFYRISVVCIDVPPLRERREDIPLLSQYFLEHYTTLYNSSVRPLPSEALRCLQSYHWPGNIRQLENVIRRFAILGTIDVLWESGVAKGQDREIHLEWNVNGDVSLREITRKAVRKIERESILKALYHCRWNRKQAAHTLRISYRALLYKLKEMGLEPALAAPLRDESPALVAEVEK